MITGGYYILEQNFIDAIFDVFLSGESITTLQYEGAYDLFTKLYSIDKPIISIIEVNSEYGSASKIFAQVKMISRALSSDTVISYNSIFEIVNSELSLVIQADNPNVIVISQNSD